jgi:hypothetical protein
MICADFLAGANLDNGNPEILPHSIRQFFKFLPGEQKHAFLAPPTPSKITSTTFASPFRSSLRLWV